jgi:hypothetical protein
VERLAHSLPLGSEERVALLLALDLRRTGVKHVEQFSICTVDDVSPRSSFTDI